MPAQLEVYECIACGNIVEVLRGGTASLECCGKDMELLEEKSADFKIEKHVPVIEKLDGGYKVTVGSTLHPMEPDHYIEWIELIVDGKSLTTFLKPGDEPVAKFCYCCEGKEVTAREHCNKHGLWKS